MRIVARAVQAFIYLGFGVYRFGQLTLGALVQHRNQVADDSQMAELRGSDVHQQILAPSIVFGDRLAEISTGCGQFALWPAELL